MRKKAKRKLFKAGLLFEGGDSGPQPHWLVKKDKGHSCDRAHVD